MSGVSLRLRVGTPTELSEVEPGEIVVTSDGVVRVNTTTEVSQNIAAIPSLIGNLGTQGLTGAQGIVGDTGPMGSTGNSGDTGFRGSRGAQGHTGSTGFIGRLGPRGSTGFTGAQGKDGYRGSHTGDKGVRGDTGSQGSGITGSQGVTGSNGSRGYTGSQGNTGIRGYTGAQGGNTGIQGVTGFTGAAGLNVIGDTGLQGNTGSTGAQGNTGIKGATGWRGVQGETGIQGVTGLTGARGWTGANGLSGFTGSQGAEGGTGAQGSQGFTGSRGHTGSTGVQGFTGTQGAQAATGTQGQSGFTGAEGAQGQTGAQGQSAVRGYTGSQGETGSTGAQGAQGSTGTQAVQGDTGITVGGPTGAQGLEGWTGTVSYRGAQGVQGDTGIQGATGFASAVAPIGSQGETGTTGAQGSTGSQGRGGWGALQGSTGSQGVTGHGNSFMLKGFTGSLGPTGIQGINIGYAALPLTNQTASLVGFTGGGTFTNNSNLVATSNHFTVPNLVTTNLTATTVLTLPPSITTMTYANSSNGGSNKVFMIRNTTSSYPMIISSPNLITYFTSNIFTQVLAHPSGWLYLYSDSNVIYSTPSNYIYIMNSNATILSNLSFTTPIYHMAVDPIGNIFVSSTTITRYTVNRVTGALVSNASIISPFPGARVHATSGYVYAYLTGATSNVYRYPNLQSSQKAFSCYPGTLSFFSADSTDKFLYSTTSSSNLFSYSVSTGVTSNIASNLDSYTYTSTVDAYTNTIYSSLSYSNSILVTALDGTSSFSKKMYLSPFSADLTSVVYNPIDSNIYTCAGNTIHLINSNGTVSLFAGNSAAGNSDGASVNASFNAPQAICVDTIGSNLYVADTGNSSIRKVALSLTNIPGLQLWLDGSDPSGTGVPPANGATVTSWIDKSGNGYNTSNLTVGNTAGKSNIYISNFQNSLGGIVLSNYAAPAAAIPTGTFANAITIFAVFKALPTLLSNAPLFYRANTTGGLNNRPRPIGLEYSQFSYDAITYPNNSVSMVQFNPSLLTTPILMSAVYNQTGSPSFYLYSNGILIGSKTSFPTSPVVGAPLNIDYGNVFLPAGRGDGAGSIWDSVFGEVLVYNTIPTTLQRQQIEAYLARKWDLPLATSHPYFRKNPLISLRSSFLTATVSTFASGLSNPQGVVCDVNTLYVSDSGNNSIRQYLLANSTMTIIAGSNGVPGSVDGTGTVARFFSPRGLGINPTFSTIYVADYSNYTVRQISLPGYGVTTFLGTVGTPGNTSTTFAGPSCIAVDSNGTVFVSDAINNVIKSSTDTQPFAGSTVGLQNGNGLNTKFHGPLGLSFKDGTLLVADNSNLLIRAIDSSSNVITYPTVGLIQLNSLQNVSVSSNSLYAMTSFTLGVNTYPALLNIPFATYAPSTFTFSNLGSNTLIQNATGRPVRISVVGQTVTNPVLPSLANGPYIATLYNTGTSTILI